MEENSVRKINIDREELLKINLKVLKNRDPYIMRIAMVCSFVTLYSYEQAQEEWVSKSLFIIFII